MALLSNPLKHIAIIMDGNGRWAQKRLLPRSAGHKKGAEALERVIKHCKKLGVSYLTVYAFSTENWKRPAQEINNLLSLLRQYVDKVIAEPEEGIGINFIGDYAVLDIDLIEKIELIHRNSAGKPLTVNFAFNYGGRADILKAAQTIAGEVKSKKLDIAEIDEAIFSKFLYTKNQPDPELIIRPSGEMRISNFFLWQAAYSELVFMDVLWPDFNETHLDQAVEEYKKRNRRMGGL